MLRAPRFLRQVVEGRPMLRKIIDNIAWLFFDKIIRLGVGLFVGVWVARYLGPQQYGLLNYALASVALFSVFVQLGLQSIVVRDIVNDPDGAALTVGTAAAMQVIGALCAYGLFTITIGFLRPEDPQAQAVMALVGLMLLFIGLDAAKYWFEAKVMSKYVVWLSSIVFLVLSGLKVVLIIVQAPLMAFAWMYVLDVVVVSLSVVGLLLFHGPKLRELCFDFGRARALLRDAWPLFLAGAAVIIYVKIDMIMLGMMKDDTEVGIYSAAVKVSELWYFIPMIIVASVFPAILAAKKQCEELYYQRLQQLFDLMVWISIGVAVPMTFLSTTIIVFLFGESYTNAGPVLAVHIWAAVFVFLGLASGKWIIAEGLQILSLQRSVAGVVTNVLLNFLLIPGFGVMGAAWATVVSYAVAGLVADLFNQRTRHIFRMKINAFRPRAAVSLMSWARAQ